MSGLILYLGKYPNFVRRIIIFYIIVLCYFLYHCTLLFGVNCAELGHSSISNKVKRPYWKIMYFFMSPMALQFFCFLKVKMLNPVNFILLCHNGSSIFLFLTHVLFVFLFWTNKGTTVHYTRPSSCVSIRLLNNFILFSPWHLDLLSSLAIFEVWMVA